MSSDLGPVMRRARLSAGITLKDIESVTGVSNAYLSQMETGKIVKPGLGILGKLAPLYGIPLETMLQLSGQIQATAELVYPTEVPDFILRASRIFEACDWEALRPVVEWMTETREQEADR